MKLRKEFVEGQIQWILSYVQEEVADVWKKNILEDLEVEEVEYKSAGEFLTEIKKKFRGGDEELVKMGERWHSGRDSCPYVLCLPQTYLRLWVQFLSSPLYWVTA